MNERVTRVVEEILKFDTDELEAVLGLGHRELRHRNTPNKLNAPFVEYEKNRAYLEAGGVGFEPKGGGLGFLVLPAGDVATLSPTILLPNGSTFVLLVTDSDYSHRRIMPLAPGR